MTIDPTARTLAIIAFLGIAATTGISLWEWNGLGALGRIQALAADTEHIYVVTDGSIYRLDRDGTLRDRVPVKELQLGPLQADAAVRQGELLLGDSDQGTVVSCHLDARRCAPAMKKQGTMAKWFAWTLKMTVDNRGHLFVSDAGRSTVEEYAPDGTHLRTYTTEPPLHFPLGVTLDEGQNVVVADSNGHQVVAVNPVSGATAWSFSTRDAPVDRGRRRPVTVARATDGRWWVLMNNMNVDAGNLVVFNADGSAPQRIPLRDAASPGALLALDDQMLVSDFDRFELLSFALDGTPLGEFGNEAFRAHFAAANQEKQQRITVRSVAWGALAGFILMGLYAGLMDKRARVARGEAANRPFRVADQRKKDPFDLSHLLIPDAAGIIWLEPDPAVLRTLRYSLAASVGLAALLSFMLTPLLPFAGYTLAAVPALLLLLNVYFYLRISRLRIGVAGDQFHLRDTDGRHATAHAAEVRHSKRRLRFGKTVVPFKPGTSLFFKQEQLDQYVFPLLRQEQSTPDWKLMPTREWITIAASVLLSAGVLLTRHYWLP